MLITDFKVYQLLNVHHLSIRKLAKVTGISASTLSETFRRPLQSWKLNVIQGLAKATHNTTEDMMKYLLNK